MSENDQANVSEGGQQQPQEYIKLKVIGQVFAYFYNQFFLISFRMPTRFISVSSMALPWEN